MNRLLPAILLAFTLANASATLIYGTGQGTLPGTRDTNWQIVAAPGSWTPIEALPYNAFVVTNAPGVFIGGGSPQAGFVFGSVTNYWIAPTPTTASIVGGSYNWIVAQTFVVDQAGYFNFNFQGAGDNELDFYINGSITDYLGDSNRPTITGGTQIGTRAGGFGYLTTFTNSTPVFMNAGANTAYMVLWDYGGETGALIGQSSFSSAAVPEPGTWASAALLLGATGYMRWRRKQTGAAA